MRYCVIDHNTDVPMRVRATRREAADLTLAMCDKAKANQYAKDLERLRAFVEGRGSDNGRPSSEWTYTSGATIRPIED